MAGRLGCAVRRRRAWATRLPVQILQADDIANAVAWLVSDQARYITGIVMPVDAGCVNKR